MIRVLVFIAVFTPVFVKADECIFDESSYTDFARTYVSEHTNASLLINDSIRVTQNNAVINVEGGGCDHLGYSIQYKTDAELTEDQFLMLIQELTSDLGSWMGYASQIKEAISRRDWEIYDGLYFFTVDEMSTLSASFNGGEVTIDFYIN
jgi:hypothetical protein